MYRRSIADPNSFWDEMAKKVEVQPLLVSTALLSILTRTQPQHLQWERPYDFVNGTYLDEGLFSWFHGGRLNASGTASFATVIMPVPLGMLL